jgi:hypothetical protein
MKIKNIVLGLVAILIAISFAASNATADSKRGYITFKYFNEDEVVCQNVGGCFGGPFSCIVRVNGADYALRSKDCVFPVRLNASDQPIFIIDDPMIECVN